MGAPRTPADAASHRLRRRAERHHRPRSMARLQEGLHPRLRAAPRRACRRAESAVSWRIYVAIVSVLAVAMLFVYSANAVETVNVEQEPGIDGITVLRLTPQ